LDKNICIFICVGGLEHFDVRPVQTFFYLSLDFFVFFTSNHNLKVAVPIQQWFLTLQNICSATQKQHPTRPVTGTGALWEVQIY
jgi:hypothetical protein